MQLLRQIHESDGVVEVYAGAEAGRLVGDGHLHAATLGGRRSPAEELPEGVVEYGGEGAVRAHSEFLGLPEKVVVHVQCGSHA